MKQKSKNKSYAQQRWTYDIKTGKVVRKNRSNINSSPRAVIYVRVSDEKQVTQGYWIEWQIRTCKDFCYNQEWEIDRIFKDEAISWWELNRKWLNEAMKYIAEQNKNYSKITHFVVTEYSRLSRSDDLKATYSTHQAIEWYGVKIVATMNPILGDDENAELVQDINYVFAKSERRKIKVRTKNGMRARLLDGHRPFPEPVWYTRIKEKVWNKFESIIVQQEPQASIIKEGLEMFANWVLVNQTALTQYFNKKVLKSNFHTPKPGELHTSFAERALSLERLMFYAWFVIYPDYDIDEPIQGHWEPILSISTVHKILQRLHSKGQTKIWPRKDSTNLYPLRWLLFWPSKGKLWGIYHYYLINSKKVDKQFKKSFRIEKIHDEFRELLQQLTPKPEILLLLRWIFESVAHDKKKLFNKLLLSKKQRIAEITKKVEKISSKYYEVKNPMIAKKIEEEWWELEQEKELLETEVNSEFLSEQEFEQLYNKFVDIIENPVAIWDLWNIEMKQLLIGVLFGWKLYYKKNEGFQTPQTSLIYSIFDHISGDNNRLGRHVRENVIISIYYYCHYQAFLCLLMYSQAASEAYLKHQYP